jgi:hypothetical protein
MSIFNNTCRGFLKKIGMGTGLVVPALLTADQPAAAGDRGAPSGFKGHSVRKLWETDVLVVGGGPAGIGAAIAAKKQCTPRSLDVTEIRTALTADGVSLDYGLKKS